MKAKKKLAISAIKFVLAASCCGCFTVVLVAHLVWPMACTTAAKVQIRIMIFFLFITNWLQLPMETKQQPNQKDIY